MAEKKRLDILLVEKALATSREKAKSLIMAGIVYVDNQKKDKSGELFNDNIQIEVRGATIPFVSRGGLKLQKAIESFTINLDDKVAMDIGASTGGFTDCMLMSGAKKVYAVDVGYGQLAWKLRTDERVINLERTNIRYVTLEQIGEKINFASVDVSFISLKLVLPVVFNLLKDSGEAICLIKPQFEAGREKVGKKGVVRDKKVHLEVIEKIIGISREIGFFICGLDYSPVKGPEGNIEYLLYISKKDENAKEFSIEEIVNKSHTEIGVNGAEKDSNNS